MTELRSVNSRYSQNAFSRKLGISPGMLSAVLKAEKAIGFTKTLEIASILDFDKKQEKNFVLSMYLLKKELKNKKGLYKYESYLADVFDASSTKDLTPEDSLFICRWEHMVILAYLSTFNFLGKLDDLIQKFKFDDYVVSHFIQRIQTIGLIDISSNGEISPTCPWQLNEDFLAGTTLRSREKILALHLSSLKNFQKNLNKSFEETCSHSSNLVIPFDYDHMDKARELIRKFEQELIELSNTGRRHHLVNLSVTFTPVN